MKVAGEPIINGQAGYFYLPDGFKGKELAMVLAKNIDWVVGVYRGAMICATSAKVVARLSADERKKLSDPQLKKKLQVAGKLIVAMLSVSDLLEIEGPDAS